MTDWLGMAKVTHGSHSRHEGIGDTPHQESLLVEEKLSKLEPSVYFHVLVTADAKATTNWLAAVAELRRY